MKKKHASQRAVHHHSHSSARRVSSSQDRGKREGLLVVADVIAQAARDGFLTPKDRVDFSDGSPRSPMEALKLQRAAAAAAQAAAAATVPSGDSSAVSRKIAKKKKKQQFTQPSTTPLTK